jgi:group I intron endonuclease
MRGVYTITNISTGKVYVGSAVNVRRRWETHRRELRRGAHPNRYLQSSWNAHGEPEFSFVLVESVEESTDLVSREQWWLDVLQSADRAHGYNISPTAYSILGYRFSDEQRANVSRGLAGLEKSPEHRANLWASREATAEFREQMAVNGRAGKGRSKSPEHKAKIGAAQRGSGNHAAKLDESAVLTIRARLATGEKGRVLAAEFGVSESIVSEIKHGRRWQHVTNS